MKCSNAHDDSDRRVGPFKHIYVISMQNALAVRGHSSKFVSYARGNCTCRYVKRKDFDNRRIHGRVLRVEYN